MLVLSRKVSEKIILRDTETGEALSVMVVEIVIRDGIPTCVRLGIDASRRFSIAREEVDGGCVRSADPSSQPS